MKLRKLGPLRHLAIIVLGLGLANALAAQPAQSPGVPDYHIHWTADLDGIAEYQSGEPPQTVTAISRHLEVHVIGDAYVDVDNWWADPISLTGTTKDHEVNTATYTCPTGNPVTTVVSDTEFTMTPAASQPQTMFIAVRTAPDGSLYVQDPFGDPLRFSHLPMPTDSTTLIVGSGADCSGPFSYFFTQTDHHGTFGTLWPPGDIPATDPFGKHFLRDIDIPIEIGTDGDVAVFRWHIEVVDLHQCAVEVCDGVDNDCDGEVDDGVLNGYHLDADQDGYGHPNALAYACVAPPGYVAGGDDCDDSDPEIYPFATEICNGADDDCDGFIDEGHPGGGAQCGDIDVGECSYGTIECLEGTLQCIGAISPASEVCDGLDNDCDDTVDEGNPGGGLSCDTGQLGVCATGTTLCSNASISCTQNLQPSAEICDGLDNDCDGVVDNGNPGSGQTCDTGLLGVCAAGTMVCSNGSVSCSQNVQPSAEICDGLDNDCDGVIDNGNPGGGLSCHTGLQGVCAAGTSICSNGSISCTQNVQPSAELCDGLDNDCDASVDEGNPNGGVACGTLLPGVCATGTTVCSGGSLSCVPTVGPSAEVCDALDNDCDGSVDEGACASAPLLASLSPARVWIGLQNDADAGIRFDLAAKIYLNDVEVGSGQLNSVPGGSSGFDNAKLDVMKLSLLAPVPVPPNSSFRIEVLVRNACSGSGKNSGRAALWYNGQPSDHGPRKDAGSRFDAKIGAAKKDYFLRQSASLSTTPGSSRLSVDQDAGTPCSAFKSFGTWSIPLP